MVNRRWRSCHWVLDEASWNSAFTLDFDLPVHSQGAMCRVPVHPRQVGVWFRIWVGGALLRIPWMAACVNLRRKGQHRLAFLPPWTRRLLIVSICQADGALFGRHPCAHTETVSSSSTTLIQLRLSLWYKVALEKYLHPLEMVFIPCLSYKPSFCCPELKIKAVSALILPINAFQTTIKINTDIFDHRSPSTPRCAINSKPFSLLPLSSDRLDVIHAWSRMGSES